MGNMFIQLNAMSLLTLVMTIGLALEFSAHIFIAFFLAPDPLPGAPGAASTATTQYKAGRVRDIITYLNTKLWKILKKLKCTPEGGGWVPTRKNRVKRALDKMGEPVIHGAITTLLGVVILAQTNLAMIKLYSFLLYMLLFIFGSIN